MTLVVKELDFLDKLRKVMENEEFRTFFHKYLDGWDDIRTSIMFMKLYACVEQEYYARNGSKLESDKIVAIIREMISDTDCRKIIMDEMKDFMQANTNLYLSTGRRFMQITSNPTVGAESPSKVFV